MKSISVVIPTHNRPQALKKAIQSTLQQSQPPLEVIVVDDVGQKKTKDFIASLGERNLHYVHNATGNGASSSRNIGIQAAKGDFVSFLDDDDEFSREKVENISNFIKENELLDLVYHPAKIHMVNEGIEYTTSPKKLNKEDALHELLAKNLIGGTSMVTIRRSFAIHAGLFDEKLPALEDYEFWLRLAQKGANFGLLNTPLTNYYYITKTESVSKNVEANEKAIEMIEKKYTSSLKELNKEQLKSFQSWSKSMLVHMYLLNGERKEAIKSQFSLLRSFPSVTNIISLFVVLAGPKTAFRIRSFISN